MQISTDMMVPRWPAPERVRAVFTTRAGGVSSAPFDSLNLGDHVGDEPRSVQHNRQRVAQTLGVHPRYVQQVHGTALLHLSGDAPKAPIDSDAEAPAIVPVADAVMSTQARLVCTIMVADCLPVLFTTRAGDVVAAAHAGWRGLAAGVLRTTVAQLQAVSDADILAWLGPCIGPTAFEVGDDVRQAFVQHGPQAAQHFAPHPCAPSGDASAPRPSSTQHLARHSQKYLADLAGLARDELRRMGVQDVYGNDSTAPWCTVRNPSRFFSHRRDRVSGRMAACIWLT